MRAAVLLALASALPGAGCSSDSQSAPAPQGGAAPPPMLGVYPDKFNCDSVAPPDALAQALGATPRVIEASIDVPHGLPKPCNYMIDGAAGPEAWTFDIDCRPGYEETAKALFAQYAQGSQDLIDEYNAVSDARQAPPPDANVANTTLDAGAPVKAKAPEPAREVQVGKRALDHHGQGLIFVDDDAPCYVRVIGPDAARRLALAQLVAKNLTPARAPMTPHAAP